MLRLRDGAAMPTLDDVRRHLQGAGLARQKWSESLYPVANFPRTASGKIQKFVLRRELRAGSLTPSESSR